MEKTNLAGYEVSEDGTNGCCVCLAAQEYASGENGCRLDGSLVRITAVFLPDSENRSMRALFHYNHYYIYAEIVDPN